jgi:hypothetical protein
MCRFKFAIVDLKLHTFLHILHFAMPGLSVRLKCAQMGLLLFILFRAITKTTNKTHKYNPPMSHAGVSEPTVDRKLI